jgi:hypothetical protein
MRVLRTNKLPLFILRTNKQWKRLSTEAKATEAEAEAESEARECQNSDACKCDACMEQDFA